MKKEKIKDKLEKKLGRPAKENELINMEKDTQLLVEVLIDEVADLDKRLKKLEP